jgi:hypothetical protein
MNIALLIAIILIALGGAAGVNGSRKPTRTGRIVFDGMWSYYNKAKIVDYDYYVKIEGFDKSGNPLTVTSPLGYENWETELNKYHRDGWSFKKSPDIAFKDAWKNYQEAGGDTFLNWTQVYTNYFWEQAGSEQDRLNIIGWIEFFFPQMRQVIIDSVPEDLRENIEVVIEGGIPTRS